MPSVSDIKWGVDFLLRLPFFLHHNITPARARRIILERLRSREQNFLRIVEHFIYANPSSPYLALMKCAGIEFGDVEALVSREGAEGALTELLKAGVYLAVDEFKGRRDAVRGSQTIKTRPSLLLNPASHFHVLVHSGGSRSGTGTPVMIDLAFIRDCAALTCTIYNLHGGDDWVKAIWSVPGASPLFRLLELSQFGTRPAKWFTQLDPASLELTFRYRYSGLALRWTSLLCAAPLPPAEHVPLDDPVPIARWMQDILAKDKTPMLVTFPSSAVRVAQAARKHGLDIEGAWFRISGEPITAERCSIISSAGANIIPRFGSMESGPIGKGCINRQASDEMHVLQDLHALIQAGGQGQALGIPDNALFVTGLRPTSPFVMLNVSLGDQADFLPDAPCGCPLGEIWPKRIANIKSFEKLTCAGMNILDTDVIRILDEVLPKRFGGAATDYQLLEKEDDDGVPGLQLLARPELGPLDEAELVRAFMQELRSESETSNTMGMTWEQGGVLKVVRRAPYSTVSGKILHLHLAKPFGGEKAEAPSPKTEQN